MIKRLAMTTLVIALGAQLSACNATPNPAPHSKGYETYIQSGELFKHTQLINIDGQPVQLAQGKKLVILFATWCSDSQRTLTELKASNLLADPTLQVVAIGREEDDKTLSAFRESFGVDFTLVADPDRQIYQHYANKGIPRLILLDEHNRVVKTLIGEQPGIIDQVRW
ncbi:MULTISPECIES: TlpA disulfide reductase family protein [unclassified Pseudoalteromonas]|uniref:TlpA family protein disulfide reductase n=1 Tax=unclassified Pseudoalteromonas TaxID=194690 RepID=UPI002096A259|nr:TlpA disulfide reductase family protein [Pseudoalteromonas sp. XMcav2-N]MCO7190959.1 TlpA family protein disulfide reductase [Pseudoalteromonas sp. XMcav2-N]